MKYHLFAASVSNYRENTFQDLVEEEDRYNGFVYWHIGNHQIHKGDICYIYYTNLPDSSKRILFVGKVVISDCDNEKGPLICPEAGEKTAKLKLRAVSLEDRNKYSLKRLKTHYKLIDYKARQISYQHIKIDAHGELISDLSRDVKYSKKNVNYVNEYFKESNFVACVFGCKTFLEESGCFYIDRHHLVEKKLIKKHENIKDIDAMINDDHNLYDLCPNCHMKIHHAKIKVRKKMIKTLYEMNKDYYDSNFTELKGGKETLNWLYDIYNCNKKI